MKRLECLNRQIFFLECNVERDAAIALGDIARIKVSKGEVDEALQLHEEMIQVFDQLGELDGRGVALWDIANILVGKGEIQKAIEHLAEAYQIMLKIGRLDGICYVGLTLGRLLCVHGDAESEKEGVRMLERSAEGFERLGQEVLAAQVRDLIKQNADKK